ncbi:MAG: hypothetical protein ABJB03_10065 [Rhodoglobus sp.]
MSDLGKYLPLSQHAATDESAVTGNWAELTGQTLVRLADLLDALGTTALDRPAMRAGSTIGDVARELFAPSRRDRLRRAATLGIAQRRSVAAPVDDSCVAARVRELAVAASGPGAKRSVHDLSIAVVTAYDIATASQSPMALNATASGAVALARSLSAPLEIRAVLRDRTLAPTDADWRLGRGPEISGTAAAIVLFLFGRAGFPAPADTAQDG